MSQPSPPRHRHPVHPARALALGTITVASALGAIYGLVAAGAGNARFVAGPRRELVAGLAAASLVALATYLLLRAARWLERQANARYRRLLEGTNDLVTLMDADTTVRYQSPAVEGLLGYRADELIGRKLSELVHPDDAALLLDMAEPSGGESPASSQTVCRIRHRDGSYRQTENVRIDLSDDPRVRGVVLTSRDISDRLALEQELSHRASHDSLTDLANRTLFEERLECALRATNGAPAPAVLFVDLDDFQTINDSLGHPVGDELLVTVGRRLRRWVREDDTVARLGGDEFALLLEDPPGSSGLSERARKIGEALAEPVVLSGRSIRASASVGMAVGDERISADELMRNADIALYRAKGEGKSRHRLYEPPMFNATRERLDLESELRRAVEEREFLLHYQPLFAVETGQVVGCEALLRWNHPERGLLAPGAFLELAQETRLIVPIGRWVAHEACRQNRIWQLRYPGLRLTMGVNLSFVQLEEATLVDEIAAALSASDVDPTRLVLEITESAMMKDLSTSTHALQGLKQLGTQLAIDDFGTGYSSLSYLKRLPFDAMKVPRPFIECIAENPRERALTQGIIALGENLGLQTISEGVETESQLERVREMGCEFAQGYLLARPAEAAAIQSLIDSVGAQAKGADQQAAAHLN